MDSEKIKISKDSELINIYCEKCKDVIMMPVKMPRTNNEIVKLLKETYHYNKPLFIHKKTFAKIILRTYVRFKCTKCCYEKLTQIQELLIQGFIDSNICKDCDLDTCLWINCKKGGYRKE